MNALENLPNEILLLVLSYFSWDELLASWWRLNRRLESLVCLMFFNGATWLMFNRPGLSYRQLTEVFLPATPRSTSALCSSIRCVHLDESNSLSVHLLHLWLCPADNSTSELRFSSLTSIHLTRFTFSEASINSLSRLVRDQLTDLRIDVDGDQFASSGTLYSSDVCAARHREYR